MANFYEGMFLVDSAKFATDADGVTNHILGILQKSGAEIVAHRPWQDGRLAYAIENQRKGLHYLVLFKLDPEALVEVNRVCKLSETIVRQLIIRQPHVVFDAMVQALVTHTTQAPKTFRPKRMMIARVADVLAGIGSKRPSRRKRRQSDCCSPVRLALCRPLLAAGARFFRAWVWKRRNRLVASIGCFRIGWGATSGVLRTR